MSKGRPFDAEIEWLQATSTQYINTKLMAADIDELEISSTVVAAGGYFPVFGNWTSDSDNVWRLLTATNGTYMIAYADCIAAISTVRFYCDIKGMHTFRFSQERASLDGVNVELREGWTHASKANLEYIALFSRRCGDYYGQSVCRPKIGRFQAFKAGHKVADFIPVRKGQVGYMYEKVSGQLFGNAGTGAFILGPDI